MKITKKQLETLVEKVLKEQLDMGETRRARGLTPSWERNPGLRDAQGIAGDLEAAQNAIETCYGKLLSAYSTHEETEELSPEVAMRLNKILYSAGQLEQALRMLSKKVSF